MPLPSSNLPRRLVLGLTALFLITLVVHFAGIALLRHLVERTLHPPPAHGTYIGQVHLNLLTGLLQVEDFQLRRDDQLRMRLAELTLDISPWRLLTGRLQIDRLSAHNGYLRIDRRADGGFDLGLPPGDRAGSSEPAAALPAIDVGTLRVERLTIDYRDADLASELRVQALELGPYSGSRPGQRVPLRWRLSWDGRAIEGVAGLTVGHDDLAIDGQLQTAPLDLARAQRLARIEPQVEGELGYQGGFAWRPPALTLDGRLQAPQLAYRDPAQQVVLGALDAAAFALRLQVASPLGADLELRQPLRMGRLEWRTAARHVGLAQTTIAGRLRLAAGRELTVEGLALRGGTLELETDGVAARLADLAVQADLRQPLATPRALPLGEATVALGSGSLQQAANRLAIEHGALQLNDLRLAEHPDDPVRRHLSGELQVTDQRVVQGDLTVDADLLRGSLSARLGAGPPDLGADLMLERLRLSGPALPHGPLRVATLTVDRLQMAEVSGFERLLAEGVALPGGLAETALQVATLELSAGRYAGPDGLSLGEVLVAGLQTGLIRDRAGRWRHVLSGAGDAGAGAPPTPAGPGPAWRVGAVRLTGDSHVTVLDRLNPDMRPVRYRIARVEFGALASQAPGADTPFQITLRPDRYAEFQISGAVRPLAEPPYLDAEGHLHGFALPTVNGVVADDLGHRFVEGQLDNDFEISIADNRLDMANRLSLAGLEVEPIEGKDGPPLGTAIALLEDRDGNIELQVPVAGDLGDPEFRVMGALNPIIMKAVAGTAALAIQPLGSVLLVGGLLANSVLQVTFAPVPFEERGTELDAKARDYLTQLAGKLREKPKLAVRLCGIALDRERRRDKQGNYVDAAQAMLDTAQARAATVRAFLADAGVGQHQARACRPSLVQDPEGLPRVDIRF